MSDKQDYEQEIITQLNDSAAKAVKGSEYGPDEHVFGIAAQIIKEKAEELKAKENVIYQLRNLDINHLLGEAVLETMSVNSKLSYRLDRVRGEVKRLLKGQT